MTCEEFRQMTQRGPTTVTRAERAAHFVHASNCSACNQYLTGPLTQAEEVAFQQFRRNGSDAQIVEMMTADLGDPEYLEETLKAFLGQPDVGEP